MVREGRREDAMPEPSATLRCAGRAVGPAEMALIREVVADCPGLSRRELAHTVCELLGWTRPQGTLKGREAREFLEGLAIRGLLALPAKRPGRPVGARTAVPVTAQGEPGVPLTGPVGALGPVTLEVVQTPGQHALFRELVGRYHYQGHAVPFGASLRYLVVAGVPRPGGGARGRARRDRGGRRDPAAEPPAGREQQPLPAPALGAGQEPGQQRAGPGGAAAAGGLGRAGRGPAPP